MKKIITILSMVILIVTSFNIVEISAASRTFLPEPPGASAPSAGQLKDHLRISHDGWLNFPTTNDFSIFARNGKQNLVVGNNYNRYSLVHFGGTGDVRPATGQNNDRKGSEYRFYGVANDGLSPVPNFNFPADFDTTGMYTNRTFFNKPWSNGVPNYAFKPGIGDWNQVTLVKTYLLFSEGRNVSNTEALAFIDEMLYGVTDPYQKDHAFYRANSRYWMRPASHTWDHIQSFTPEKRRNTWYVSMPATTYTYGIASEWHRCSVSASGSCYDTTWIEPLAKRGPDLAAVNIKTDRKSSYLYEISFTARNNSSINIVNEVATKYQYKVGNGPWTNGGEDVYHDSRWTPGRDKEAHIGALVIPPGTPAGTPIRIRMEINSTKVVEEENYANNVLEKVIYAEESPMCSQGGVGTSDTYGYWVCGMFSCWKVYKTAYLTNTASVDYIDSKQTLLGVWSRNSQSHKSSSAANATGADFSSDKFHIDLEGEFVDKLKKMGIEDPKRVIRAGRAVQMYSTIEVNLDLSSFTSAADLDSKKTQFLNKLKSSLESRGVVVVSGGQEIKNNKGNTTIPAQLDTGRSFTKYGGKTYSFSNTSDGYMYKHEGPLRITKYGDRSVKQLIKYEKTYKFVIPVKTKNEGGEQETNQGDFVDEKSYNVKDETSSFYTHINSQNGLKGIELRVKMDNKALDPVFSGEPYCTSETEAFEVNGNIFDDVRTEDQSDHEFDDEWDF